MALASRSLLERLDVARVELTSENGDSPLDGFAGVDVHRRWAQLDLEKRRKVAAVLIDRVTILPPARRGNTFDPDRVDIIWKA